MKQSTALAIMKSGRNVFLTGSAGTGKTFLINQFVDYLKERKIKPAIVAPTGIAASHIGGTTIHSFFGVGIKEKIDEYQLDFLLQKKYLHERFSKLKVLIVDEVSMLSPDLFNSMDKILRAFRFSDRPFGGVQLILSGDFFQLPPVSKEWKEIRFIWQTELWKNLDLKIAYLEEKFRQDDDILISILDEIRSGEVSERTWEILKEKMQKKIDLKIKPTRLYTHNADVDKINLEELDKIEEVPHFFEAVESGQKKYIESIYKSSLVQEKVELKKGAVVIFIKNNYDKGYINGTLGVVIDFDEETKMPLVEIASGRKILVEREEWSKETDSGKVQAVVKQIPLRLAWAITVHKSQGMTLDAAEIDLSKTFEAGQGYVALSRIKSIDGLKLVGINPTALIVDHSVLSIDQKFREFSRVVEKQWNAFSDEEKEKFFLASIVDKGGTTDEKEIEKNKKELEIEKEKSSLEEDKISTYQKTKDLILAKKDIKEIADERFLTEATILNHLRKLLDDGYLEKKEIEYLKPDIDILDSIEEVVEEIKKDNKKDDFTEKGEIKLSAIYKMLDGELSYEEIRLALLFLD